ncbi:Arm DNA-binding domain-containing protein [Xanthobacter lutulentifluminis]|uniref:Arm DNA-binding domain-containing protein n=1 Tax=Xanthobacter lutulentifluminis TaxID=3119935 RepID=UPI0037361230
MHLLVNPNGSRIWRLAYRFAGKPKQLPFGPYPTVPLVEARQKREEAKRRLLAGEDPSAIRKLEKVAASVSSANTFSTVAVIIDDAHHRREPRRTVLLLIEGPDLSWARSHGSRSRAYPCEACRCLSRDIGRRAAEALGRAIGA